MPMGGGMMNGKGPSMMNGKGPEAMNGNGLGMKEKKVDPETRKAELRAEKRARLTPPARKRTRARVHRVD